MPVFNTVFTNLSESFSFRGDSNSDYFGRSVSGAGDVNGDGFDDLIVGAVVDDNNGVDSGSAQVFSGADGSVLFTFDGDAAGDFLGYSVSGAGDVNGDGFNDVIVGADLDDNNGDESGSARVFSGADGSILFTFSGDSEGDHFGRSVSGAGDVNADGFDDVIIGAVFDDNNGRQSGSARVFSGSDGSLLYTFDGNVRGDLFGYSVSTAGDVDGDGFDDVIIGALDTYSNGSYTGSARIHSGADGSMLFAFYGDSTRDRFGHSVSSAGDVNGDGFDDVIVGSYHDDNNGRDSGSARVLSGADGSTLFTFNGDGTCDNFGFTVSGAGDINGDGFDDVIVGAPFDDNNGSSSGSVQIFSGIDGSVLFSLDGYRHGDNLGISVSDAGDVNGDGFADIFIGAHGATYDHARLFTTTGTGALDTARVFIEDGGPVVLDDDVAIADVVMDALNGGDGDYHDASLNIARQAGANADDVFAFADMVNVTVNGGNLEVNGNVIATFTTTGGNLNISFTNANGASPTTALVNEIIQAVTYENPDQTLTTGQLENIPLTWTFSDGTSDLVDTITIKHQGTNDAPTFDATLINMTAAFTFNGGNLNDYFGKSVSAVGDVNGDGFDDVIVGAFGDDNNGNRSGSAQVLSGIDGTVLLNFNGDNDGDEFGYSVSSAGDVNNDGIDDLIIGAPGDDSNGPNSGSARVLSGVDGTILYTFYGDDTRGALGGSVSSAGDVNGDGFDDVIVGAPRDTTNGSYSGSARVFSGFDGAELYTFYGDNSFDFFGGKVSSAGDVNGDGFDDVIVGAIGNDSNGSSSGIAKVFSGLDGTVLFTFTGDSGGDNFGGSVSSVGDVNGDGFDDVIVGAKHDDGNGNYSGSAKVLSGQDGTILFNFNGNAPLDFFGISVSSAGDVNGDGFDDFIVGSFANYDNAYAGSAQILSGLDGAVLFTFNGDDVYDYFGSSVSSAGDVNGDGFDDIIIGAYRDNNNGIDSGSARLFTSTGTGRLDSVRVFAEGNAAVVLDGDVAVADVEFDALNGGDGDYHGGSLNIQRQGGGNTDDVFAFAAINNVTINGGNLEVAGVVIAIFTTAGGVLNINFTNANGSSPTTALVNEIIQAVTYENTDTEIAIGEHELLPLEWVFSDGVDDLSDIINISHSGIGVRLLVGTAGNDTLIATLKNETIDGLAATDTLDFGVSTQGVTVNLNLTGPQATGGSGDDTIINIENLLGGVGDDRFVGSTGRNELAGRDGNDDLFGLGGYDVLDGDAGDDLLVGGSGRDWLNGGDDQDRLLGGVGDDFLHGDAGDDMITGGVGRDQLFGDAGADTFIFNDISETGLVYADRDIIRDFSQTDGDKIDLSGIDAVVGGGDDGFTFLGTGAGSTFTGTAGELRAGITPGGQTVLWGDVDGDGVRDFSLVLDGAIMLIGADFIL